MLRGVQHPSERHAAVFERVVNEALRGVLQALRGVQHPSQGENSRPKVARGMQHPSQRGAAKLTLI